MRRKDLYRSYIRRANGREKAGNWRIAIRLAFYQEIGRPFCVMVQKGFPDLAIEVGPSRDFIKRGILVIGIGRMRFQDWARLIKRRAQGNNAD